MILGATGSGKTEVACEVAEQVGAEIVVADSRQVYRGFDIGSNKPTPAQRSRARFHLVDIVDPRAQYTVFDYVSQARSVIADIWRRGRMALVEGATMLYVRALTEGFNLARTPRNPALRQELAGLTAEQLALRLRELDPTAAVDFHNPVRLVRAIETVMATGAPLSGAREASPPPWRVLKIGLRLPPGWIDEALARRTREQLERGLAAEARAAIRAGVPSDAAVLTGVGAGDVLRVDREGGGEGALYEAVLRSNRRLARRQLRWLRTEPQILWFDAQREPVRQIVELIRSRES